MIEPPEIIVVQWDNSGECVGWHFREDADYSKIKLINSVGYKVYEDEKVLSITSHWTDDGKQLCSVMTIPKSAIRDIYALEVEK